MAGSLMVQRRRAPLARLAMRGVAALALAWPATQAAPQAGQLATLDLLDLPAAVTAHGQRKLLLDVAPGGPGWVAVGAAGLLLGSADQGKTWTQQPSPTSVLLTSVTFVNANTGWAVGHDGVIIATTDSGRHWVRQFDGRRANEAMLRAAQAESDRAAALPGDDEATRQRRDRAADALSAAQAAIEAGPSQPLFNVRFSDAQRGYVVGAFGQLFTTEDGGANWRYIGDRLGNPEGLHLNSLTIATDGAIYIAAEAGTVFISRDQGKSWTRASVGYDGHLFGVLALHDKDGSESLLAYGFKGHLFRSRDQGATWTQPIRPAQKTIVQGMVRNGAALLLTEDGQLLESRDGGEHFRFIGTRMPLTKCSSFSLQGDTLIGVGQGGLSVLPVVALTKTESGS